MSAESQSRRHTARRPSAEGYSQTGLINNLKRPYEGQLADIKKPHRLVSGGVLIEGQGLG